jgi:hypothetical protein
MRSFIFGALDFQRDQIATNGQSNRNFNDLPAVASSFQLCFSGNQYAEVFAIADLIRSGEIFY